MRSIDKSKSEGTLELKPRTPGPLAYCPKVTCNGKEAEMADLNGAELNQMSSFVHGVSSRSGWR